MRRTALTGAAAALLIVGASAPSAHAHPEQEWCSPIGENRPVCSSDAPADTATFLDPTARISGARQVLLGTRVYVGPFAELRADASSPIRIGAGSDLQDNVLVDATTGTGTGVDIGERVIVAHGSSVLGPAEIGVRESPLPQEVEAETYGGSVFMSFGARVDGGTVEVNAGVSALGRVGPGVTLHSGYLVQPGKDVTTQAEADDPALGKVRFINQADVEFNEGVIHVNESLARAYTELYREDPAAVRGVNVDPGHTDFNADRELPSFAGQSQARPGSRNRIIGDVDLTDPFTRFRAVAGDRISLRADEGEPFVVGQVDRMGDDVVLHALEHTDIHLGDRVHYGDEAIVHGGGRVIVEGQPEVQTVVGDDVWLGDESVVFRSTIGDGARIGDRSAVVGTDLPAGTVVPPNTIVLNGAVFGAVEW
jgi:carbonic anhydrase/acetyltransferase-like protein (isoleucine patch superfamily)